MALLWEVIITLVYWTILWPFENHPPGKKFEQFCKTSLEHLLPIIYLLVDFCFNRIYFEWHQIWVQMGVFVCYGVINITVTFRSDVPVYPPMSYDSVLSWCIALSLLPFSFGVYAGLFYLTRWKFKKLKMETNNEDY